MLTLCERSIDGSLSFGLVEASLAQNVVHKDIVIVRLLLHFLGYHALDGLLLSLLLLFRVLLLFLLLLILGTAKTLFSFDHFVSFLNSHQIREIFLSLDVTRLLLHLHIFVRVDHLLLSSSTLFSIVLFGSWLFLFFFLLLEGTLSRGLFVLLRWVLDDILVSKIDEVVLIALVTFSQDVLLQFMGIQCILLFFFNLISHVPVRLISDAHFVLFILVYKLLIGVQMKREVLRLRFTELIDVIDIIQLTQPHQLIMLALRALLAPTRIIRTAQGTLNTMLIQNAIHRGLAVSPAYGFAFMQLFQRNKRPEELDPIFKRQTKLKGHLKSKATKSYSKKLNTNVRKQKQKLRNHKGLLKRIKIVGPRWNRRFKFQAPGSRHLHRHKSRANLIMKRRARYVHKADMRKVKKMVPYYKRKSLKMRH